MVAEWVHERNRGNAKEQGQRDHIPFEVNWMNDGWDGENKKDEEDVFTIILDKVQLNGIRERLPFLKDADEFVILNDRE